MTKRVHPADVNNHLNEAIQGTSSMISDAMTRGDAAGAAAYTIALQDLEAAYRTLSAARSEQRYGEQVPPHNVIADTELAVMAHVSKAPHRFDWRRAFAEVAVEIHPSLNESRIGRESKPEHYVGRVKAQVASMRQGQHERDLVVAATNLKHGPGGTGARGPCDAGCRKCAIDLELHGIRSASTSVQEGNRVIDEALADPKPEWTACDACKAKPGSPVLCHGCLRNRTVFGRMKARLNNSCESLYPIVRGLLDAIWRKGMMDQSAQREVYELGVEFQKLEKKHAEVRTVGGIGGINS